MARARKQQVALADAVVVEAVHALGVDQDRADLHADEERGGHAGPALVEEVDHRRVGAHRHDQVGAPLEGHEHGDVLGGAGGGEDHVGHAQLLEQLRPGARPSV
jgi:hypothetical protein